MNATVVYLPRFCMKLPGIYLIVNTLNGKIYVGSSVNIQNRWWKHQSNLNRDVEEEENTHLISAWKKYGSTSFIVEVVEYCPGVSDGDLRHREDWWIELLGTLDPNKGYNKQKATGGPTGQRRSEETKAKIGAANKGNTVWRGRKHKPESIEKIRTANTGKRATPETIIKLSKSHMGQKAKNWEVVSPTGEVFVICGLSQLCRDNKLDSGNMSKVASGKKSQHKGWKVRELPSNL